MIRNYKFDIIDNRGKKRDLMPHEAFSAVKKVDGRVVLSEHCYTHDEAVRVLERWKRQRGIPK